MIYLSKKLLPPKQKYNTIEREAYALKQAINALCVYLWGQEFTIMINHQSLTWLQQMKYANSWLTRWYLALQPYHFSIIQ